MPRGDLLPAKGHPLDSDLFRLDGSVELSLRRRWIPPCGRRSAHCEMRHHQLGGFVLKKCDIDLDQGRGQAASKCPRAKPAQKRIV